MFTFLCRTIVAMALPVALSRNGKAAVHDDEITTFTQAAARYTES
jgi:hypothetical protein